VARLKDNDGTDTIRAPLFRTGRCGDARGACELGKNRCLLSFGCSLTVYVTIRLVTSVRYLLSCLADMAGFSQSQSFLN
jgi:hypothetical protein